jgi:Type II secretion system (T2SS), protein G
LLLLDFGAVVAQVLEVRRYNNTFMKKNGKVIGIVGAILFAAVFACMVCVKGYASRPSELAARLGYTHFSLNSVALASSSYHQFYGRWPTSLQDFGIYSPRNPKHYGFLTYANTFSLATSDGWFHPLIYKPFDPSVGYGSVISYGRDGQPGGVGPDADIEVRFGRDN